MSAPSLFPRTADPTVLTATPLFCKVWDAPQSLKGQVDVTTSTYLLGKSQTVGSQAEDQLPLELQVGEIVFTPGFTHALIQNVSIDSGGLQQPKKIFLHHLTDLWRKE